MNTPTKYAGMALLSLSFTAMAADVKPGKAKTLQGSTLAIEVVDWFCYD